MDDAGATPHRNPPIRHRMYWAIFLGIWTVLALMIRWHVLGLERQVHREGLSNAAVVACRNVLIDHVDIETGLRGYLITGSREYLRPYHEGLGRADRDLADLRSAVEMIPVEQAHYESATEASRQVLQEFANQISTAESQGLERGRTRFVAFPTKPGMDRIRISLTTIQADEDRRLAANMAALDRSMATTIFMLNGAAGISFVLLVAMASGFINPPAGNIPRAVA